jgi:hypothetical protein
MWFVNEDYEGLNAKVNTAYKELGFGAAVVLVYINVLTWQLKLPFRMHFAKFFTSCCLLEEL